MKYFENIISYSLDSTVTLYPLPTLEPATPLAQAKAAFSFTIHSYVEHTSDHPPATFSESEGSDTKDIPSLVTKLIVGCRRKVVIYTWKDGDSLDVKVNKVCTPNAKLTKFQEAPLPHSPRVITFIDNSTMCFAYTATEYAVFSETNMTVMDVQIPAPVATTSTSGTFGNLGGYMTLGLGAKAKPCLIRVNDSETLLVKDSKPSNFYINGKISNLSPHRHWALCWIRR